MNDVTATGVVVSSWQYDGDTFLRLISHRGRGDPPNPDGKNFDAFTLRFNFFLQQQSEEPLPQRGDKVRVHGLLQQRDVEETLESLLKHQLQAGVRLSQQERKALVETGNGVRFRQSVTEVLVLGWERLGGNGKSAAKRVAADKPVAEPEEEDEVAEVPEEVLEPEPVQEPEPEPEPEVRG
jgi:hypothetical protein